ncbi:MAG: AAA family ATPase [Proteobacteria bacterium]|nr:AAA family ATPase [Pseudomonadota bacterium]
MLLEREQPRLRLEAALRGARAGTGRIVSLEGEAGIGKTSAALDFLEAHRSDTQVYVGGCEHLSTPEPLGPLRDIERNNRGRFNVAANSPLTTFNSLLRLMTSQSDPGLLLVEDLHWADDPTLDLFRFLGRRIRTARLLVIATFRNDEVNSQPRLAALWSDMPRDSRERIELERLSPAAVATLSAGVRWAAAEEIYSVTGGNPFHVTEYLAAGRTAVPRSVRDATLARTARLSSHARRALDCASIFPRHIDQSVLRELTQDVNDQGVEECMRAGMLSPAGNTLAFRHELARRAIHDAMSPLRRLEMHAAALGILKSKEHVRAAEIAHHAEQAGAAQDLVHYAQLAAEEAQSLGAHREAFAHFARALRQGTGLSNADRANMLQRQAEAGEQCGALSEAITAIEDGIIARKHAGDILGLGDALRISARIHWLHGESDVAEAQSAEALEILRDHPQSPQYAMASSAQSQLDMLALRPQLAVPGARQAMALAEKLNRWDIYLHALTNLTAARCSADVQAGSVEILAAIDEAGRRGQPDLLPRLYTNLVYMMMHDRVYLNLFELIDEGVEAAVARDNAPLEAYMRGTRALALLDLGRTREAITEAEFVVFGPYPRGTSSFTARLALARARIRTGIPEEGVLDEARSLPTSTRDIMRRAPLAVVDAEALWLGLPRPGAVERLRAAHAHAQLAQGQLWYLAETALWLKILGEPIPNLPATTQRVHSRYKAHLAGEWRAACDAWSDLGCPYEQAIALAAGDESARREALGLFEQIGAVPAAARLRRQMRADGLRDIPRGPIAKTRASPAGLTARQSEVLTLLIQGKSNADIAERLSISLKTAEHHVSAVMTRLEITTRRDALKAARDRGMLDLREK